MLRAPRRRSLDFAWRHPLKSVQLQAAPPRRRPAARRCSLRVGNETAIDLGRLTRDAPLATATAPAPMPPLAMPQASGPSRYRPTFARGTQERSAPAQAIAACQGLHRHRCRLSGGSARRLHVRLRVNPSAPRRPGRQLVAAAPSPIRQPTAWLPLRSTTGSEPLWVLDHGGR